MAQWTPNFDWVQEDLALGGSFPIEQAARLACDHGLGAIVDLRSEACDDAAALAACGLRFLHLPTPDMSGVDQPMLDLGVDFAAQAAQEGRRLLIHCEHGIGRSAVLALCVLVDRGFEPLAALRLAKDARALVSPSRAQHEAWVQWLSRRFPAASAPTYHEFGVVAYRHLACSA
jgi:hypothetical protein